MIKITEKEYLKEIDTIYAQFKSSNHSEMDHEILSTKLMWLTMDYKEGTSNNMWKDEI